MATVHQTFDPAAITSLATTQLNALAAGAFSTLGTAYDNATNCFLYGLFQLDVTFAAAPIADTDVDLFLVPAPDGTNYGQSGSQNFAVGAWNITAVLTQQLLTLWAIPLPPTLFKVQVFNNTDKAFPATGSTVKMIPYGLKAV